MQTISGINMAEKQLNNNGRLYGVSKLSNEGSKSIKKSHIPKIEIRTRAEDIFIPSVIFLESILEE